MAGAFVTELAAASWPIHRVAEAADALARAVGIPVQRRPAELGRVSSGAPESGEPWVEHVGTWLGLELEPVGALYNDVDEMIQGCGPGLIELDNEDDGDRRLLAVVRSSRRWLVLLAPDGAERRMKPQTVARALRRRVDCDHAASIDAWVHDLGLAGKRAERARAALLAEQLAGRGVEGVWLLRHPAGASFGAQLDDIAAGRRATAMLLGYAAQYLMFIGAWWMIGYGAFSGAMDTAWLLGFALLILGRVPLQVLCNWVLVRLSIDVSALLRRRLLVGATHLHPDEVRSSGAGELLGRVIESDSFEEDLKQGAPPMPVGVLELAVASLMLGFGAGGLAHAMTLLAWTAVLVFAARRLHSARRAWTRQRVALTHGLVERMVGHTTRLAQEPAADWHLGEDGDLARYQRASIRMERSQSLLLAVVPRGWLLLAMAGLVPAVAVGHAAASELALSVGGALLAYTSYRKLTVAFERLARVAISWEVVAELFHSAARRERIGPPDLAAKATGDVDAEAPVIQASELSYRYPGRVEPVLRNCDIDVLAGDRLLLRGPSGGGKSTFGACLNGVREPDGGLLLAGGLDRHSLGDPGWRRRVAGAPQFHENHVFNAPLLFNLLVARQWPPAPADVAEAERICDELGLGPLLERMPGGLLQMVGETGWQLSHGERSRVFVARALLQDADVLVLDESFGALDPATCDAVLQTVFRRAKTLLVIAHT